MSSNKTHLLASLYALGSAFLFAIGIPCAKLLLDHVDSTMLAGLLYLSSGIGLTLILLAQAIMRNKRMKIFAYNRNDFPWLLGATVTGGILAPLFLMAAINFSKASSVSLLLNFEVVLTALIACLIFKEHLTPRVLTGLGAILTGGICLSWSKDLTASWALLLVLGACLCWAIDSNLVGQIKNCSAIQIAQFKGIVAGLFNLALAFFVGSHLPDIITISGAAITGFVSYGISFCLFVTAVHKIGAARAMAYFSTEPFIGALLSVLILKEPITINLLLAAFFMGIGVWLHLTEKHHEQGLIQSIPDSDN